jgi:transcriptional regulator with XRE-family HTH domain
VPGAKTAASKPGWIVGRNVREMRIERSWTQDDAARRLRQVGLPWTRSHIAALESQRRDDVSMSELVFLSAAFGVAPERWLEGGEQVQMGERLVVPLDYLRRILRGDGKAVAMDDASVTGVLEWRLLDQVAEAAMEAGAPLTAFREVPSEAERHAGRTLGIDPVRVYELACRLWDHGLDEEREVRLEERGQPMVRKTAYRGHITRQLLKELREQLPG